MIVKIGSFDLTSYVLVGNYKVNQIDENKDWVDGRGITHRDLIRKRVKGDFDVFFKDMSVYDLFVQALKRDKKPNNAYDCEIMCNNVNEPIECECFIEFEPERSQDGSARDRLEAFQVSVEER